MFRGLTVELECDGCGRLFRVDHADGAFRIPAGWTLFDLVMDVARWHGTGHVYADGRWFCDACDNAAGGCPGGEETDDATDAAADAERPGLKLPVEYSTVEIRCLQRDLDSIRKTANGATRTAEELLVLLDDVNNAFDCVVKWAAATREYWDADADMKVGKRLIALSGRLPGYAAEIDAVHALRIRVKNTLERFPTNATGPRIEPLGTAEGLTKNVWQIAAQRALIEANRRLDEISDALCGQNFTVLGWHQNGDAEPLDSWFENNEWGPVVLSDYEPPADAKPQDPTEPVGRALTGGDAMNHVNDRDLPASVGDVGAERVRQIREEGWSADHDDRNHNGELATAGGLYALEARNATSSTPRAWPWDDEWWKPTNDRRRNLVKAAALICAEIDRIDRERAADALDAPAT